MRFEVGAILRATSYKQTAKPAIQITKQFLSKFFRADGALIPVPNERIYHGRHKKAAFLEDKNSLLTRSTVFRDARICLGNLLTPKFRFELCCERFQITWNESIGPKYATDTN